MPNLKKGADCCGCTACASICGHSAITMTPDALGFKYPIVNPDLCVECGLCERVCNFKADYSTPQNFESPIPYGVRQKDTSELMKSRSGGAFGAFSDWVLDKGGVVYGAGYKGHFEVAHCRVDNKADRDMLRGSKYVQSNLDGIFKQVRADLIAGKWVLFSGTPCQTSGLQSFLPDKLKERLLVVDIVCHSVPSPYIWSDYLKDIEKKMGRKVVAVDFRDKKRFGWAAHKETITFEDGTLISDNSYTYLFQQNIMLRDSCANCHFTNLRRPSDLTLADFWGWEKTDTDFNRDNRGASLVLVNTPKGMMVFDEVKNKFDIIKPQIENIMQRHLKEHTVRHPKSESFKRDYIRQGFEYVLNKYGNKGWRYNVNTFKKRVTRKLKNIFKIS